MRPEDFEEGVPGKLVRASRHWTCEPNSLPPPWSPDPSIWMLLSEADHVLGQLAGVGRTLPNPHLLIGPFLRREAVLSSRIEGTVTQLDELFLFEMGAEESSDPDDAEEVFNYVKALNFGLERLAEGMPLCLRLLREVHAVLLQGVRGSSKMPGEFRNGDVQIGGRSGEPWNARFVPPMHTALNPLLKEFERFLNSSERLPIVIELAMAHYQFEAIHPFFDGNGRLGRLLITLMLCERRALPKPLLYLSAYFERNDEEYKDRMLDVSQRGRWTEWISFFARGVAEEGKDASRRAMSLMDLWSRYRKRIQSEPRATTSTLELVDAIFLSPFLTVSQGTVLTKSSVPTVQRAIDRLVETGILRELTGQSRNRVYVATEVLKLMNDPLEQEP